MKLLLATQSQTVTAVYMSEGKLKGEGVHFLIKNTTQVQIFGRK